MRPFNALAALAIFARPAAAASSSADAWRARLAYCAAYPALNASAPPLRVHAGRGRRRHCGRRERNRRDLGAAPAEA